MLLNTMETVAENEEPGLKCLSMTFDEEHLPNTRWYRGVQQSFRGNSACEWNTYSGTVPKMPFSSTEDAIFKYACMFFMSMYI